MKIPTIVLAELDEEYLAPIELKMIRELGADINLEVISEADYFEEYFLTEKNIDVLIIAEQLFKERLLKHMIGEIFVLQENPNNVVSRENVHYIYKYSSVKDIYNEVMYETSASFLKSGSKVNETTIISVYSPIGGAGKTTLALGLATILNESHFKTLYIDAERMQTFQFYLQNKEMLPSSVMIDIQGKEKVVYDSLKHYIRHEVFDYLPPFCATLSSLGLDISFFEYFIDSAKQSRDYDYIVIDFDNCLDNYKFSLFKKSDKVFLVQRANKKDYFDMEIFLNNVNTSDHDKFLIICNEYDSAVSNIPNMVGQHAFAAYIDKQELPIQSIRDIQKIGGLEKIRYLIDS